MIIVDTGPIVALINPRDQYHHWARTAIRQINEPMLTCDAVLSEALFLVSSTPNGIRRFTEILSSGAIFANVLEIDEHEQVMNAKHAEKRAAQFILQYITGKKADPPFQDWEVALHPPPPRTDPK